VKIEWKISPVSGSGEGMSPESMKAMMKETLKEMLGGPPPEVQKLPGQAVPIEEVELIGEKINYKRALGVDDSPAREANK
jgi:hypothetical protein